MKIRYLLLIIVAIASGVGGFFAGAHWRSSAERSSAPGLGETQAPAAARPVKAAGLSGAVVSQDDALEARFRELAKSVSPEEALALAADSPDPAGALRALLLAWVEASGIDGDRKNRTLESLAEGRGRPGELMRLAALLSLIPELAAMRQPCINAFADSPARSQMLAWLHAADAQNDPERLAEISSGWLPWEKQAFEPFAGILWAQKNPQAALDWCRQHPDADPGIHRAAAAGIGGDDPAKLEELLKSPFDPEREAAARELGTSMARDDTRAAVLWADALPEGPEKDAAHEAIYQATPRGVGAVLSTSETVDGMPMVQKLVPDGPLERAGFQNGDVLTGLETEPGKFTAFQGQELSDIVNQLRGEPGTQITVVGMRRDSQTGQWQEYRAVVSREQVLFSQRKPVHQ